MDRHGAIAGTAAALMGSMHFAVGALAMLLVGWLGSGQPLAMLLGIAGCALWLLSDLGRSTTGEVVHVDAGFHIVGVPSTDGE